MNGKKDSGVSPAALSALANGDFENFLVASMPGGIEAQEKRGQMEQAKRSTLPVELGSKYRGTPAEHREPWEALGFVFTKTIVDQIFVEVMFPEGWKKKPTDHSMWSEIVDDKGRVRGMIFYKAAFYDRSAHAHLTCRFTVRNDYEKPITTVSVKDACGEVEFKVSGLEAPDYSGDRAKANSLNVKIDQAVERVKAFLKNNYPDYENPCAYWA